MTPLSAELHDLVGKTLWPAFANVDRVAILDFPNYPNVGDSAIWMGQLAFFRQKGIRIAYTCDIDTYDAKILSRRLPATGGAIVFSGGGSLGDIWERYQDYREAVISSFPRHRVIQLPQSICFLDSEARQRARSCFSNARDLHLFVRDEMSLERAREELGMIASLCPDVAFCGRLPATRASHDRQDVLWLCRADREGAQVRDPTRYPGPRLDWESEPRSRLISLTRSMTWRMRDSSVWRRALRTPLSRSYPIVAQSRLARGVAIVRSAKVVVTDRLHGHILCLMAATPHVLLDTVYGKVRDFHHTWSDASPLVRWADSIEEAQVLAEELLQ